MTTEPSFSCDRPLTNRDEDRLNRAAFADHIATILAAQPEDSGVVVGVYGVWGDGKTTVLNLLRAKLADNDAVVVRDFNPWRVTDSDSVFRGFFSTLAEAIDASLSTCLERARARAGRWAWLLRWITWPLGLVFKPVETADSLLSRFGKMAQKGDSVRLERLRDRVVDRLRQSRKRVIILIDDIDRLDKHETHTLFRLIKACTDFPNACYVLAFDDTAVSRAIGERYGGGGEAAGRSFLEKIVQVPLRLPVAAREDLRSLCFDRIDQALSAAGIELTDRQVREFVAAFDRSVSIRLATPREANRFGNGLMFALPALVGETNPVDHLLVEALRAFYPDVYEVVRENQAAFYGVEERSTGAETREPRAVGLLEPALSTMAEDHTDAVKTLISTLFPRLSGPYSNTWYGLDSVPRWSKDQRVCAPEYCPRYFTYSVPQNDVPDSEVTAILETASGGDGASLESRLVPHLHGAKAGRLIEKLRAVEETVDPMAAKPLAVALSRSAKTIPSSPSFYAAAEPSAQAAILVSHLLQRIPRGASRIAAGRRVLEVAEPLWFGAECLRWMYVTDKPDRQDSNTFSRDDIAELRSHFVRRIKSRAEDGFPLFDPDVQQEEELLREWARAEGREAVQEHLVRVFEADPEQITKFVLSQSSRAWSLVDGTRQPRELVAERFGHIDHVIDVFVLADLVRKHCSGNFDEPEWRIGDDRAPEERILEQFMYLVNQRKKGGAAADSGDDGETQ